MTPRPPLPMEPFSEDERDLAARLGKLDATAGPSAALDARILAAARSATAPARPARRWPGAFGAAAVLVAAVGLAWQLRPMFELPPPGVRHAESVGDAGTSGAQSETVVQIENVRRAPTPVAPAGSEAAASAPAAASRRAQPVAGGAPLPRPAAVPVPPRAHAPDFVDEALPITDAVPAPAAVPAPPPPPSARESLRVAPQAQSTAVAPAPGVAADTETPDVSADARLATPAWLARIRERRDAGDVDGARASLQRFIAAHPRVLVPSDLRPLLRDDDPWSP